jgi:murein DD-endopeptidase MepM/ murein hydrolase activator NlpD
MARRLLTVLFSALLLAGTAAADNMDDRKRAIDAQLSKIRNKISAANEKEAVLSGQISVVTSKIRALQDDVDVARARVATLEDELTGYKNRLARLQLVYELQTEQLELLREQQAVAEQRLAERLVAIYQSDDPDAVEVVLAARSFTDMLDQLDYLRELGEQDRRIAKQVEGAKIAARKARTRTERTRLTVGRITRAVEERTNEQRAVRDRLVASQAQLASARAEKKRTLAGVESQKRDLVHEEQSLVRESAEVAARIQSAQSSAPSLPRASGSSGFIWPVNGTLTSTFGWRWGRMHEGIDIGAPAGTPIAAAASGVVIYAGWLGGYGNLVVIDHGGGIATAYAHQSSIAVGVGQQVSQGQTIGYVGSTGHSTGNHLHFEVRVQGSAVDPLGYL